MSGSNLLINAIVYGGLILVVIGVALADRPPRRQEREGEGQSGRPRPSGPTPPIPYNPALSRTVPKRGHERDPRRVRKKCARCHRIRPVAEFTNDRRQKDGMSRRCKECERELRLARLPAHKRAAAAKRQAEQEQRERLKGTPAYEEMRRARNREHQRRFHEQNPGYSEAVRAKRLGALLVEVIPPKEVFERDDWTCHICGELVPEDAPWRSPQEATLDHVVPLSLGGDHVRENLACAHRRCNSIKGTIAPIECESCGETISGESKRCRWCGFLICD